MLRSESRISPVNISHQVQVYSGFHVEFIRSAELLPLLCSLVPLISFSVLRLIGLCFYFKIHSVGIKRHKEKKQTRQTRLNTVYFFCLNN